eukprot:1653108-Rhodomonas_salina.1
MALGGVPPSAEVEELRRSLSGLEALDQEHSELLGQHSELLGKEWYKSCELLGHLVNFWGQTERELEKAKLDLKERTAELDLV